VVPHPAEALSRFSSLARNHAGKDRCASGI
jgi:hypothetical protein